MDTTTMMASVQFGVSDFSGSVVCDCDHSVSNGLCPSSTDDGLLGQEPTRELVCDDALVQTSNMTYEWINDEWIRSLSSY